MKPRPSTYTDASCGSSDEGCYQWSGTTSLEVNYGGDGDPMRGHELAASGAPHSKRQANGAAPISMGSTGQQVVQVQNVQQAVRVPAGGARRRANPAGREDVRFSGKRRCTLIQSVGLLQHFAPNLRDMEAAVPQAPHSTAGRQLAAGSDHHDGGGTARRAGPTTYRSGSSVRRDVPRPKSETVSTMRGARRAATSRPRQPMRTPMPGPREGERRSRCGHRCGRLAKGATDADIDAPSETKSNQQLKGADNDGLGVYPWRRAGAARLIPQGTSFSIYSPSCGRNLSGRRAG